MRLTKENLKDLRIGQKIYVAKSYSDHTNLIYMGIFEDCYCFAYPYSSDFLYLPINNPDARYEFKSTGMFTEYEECCERMRELFLDIVEHFNKHQFKNNPIIVQRERLNEETTKEQYGQMGTCSTDFDVIY